MAGTVAGNSPNTPGSLEKSIPPFCVTRIEPSAASAAPFAPPVVTAICSTVPVSGCTPEERTRGDAGRDDGAVGTPHRALRERNTPADNLGSHGPHRTPNGSTRASF